MRRWLFVPGFLVTHGRTALHAIAVVGCVVTLAVLAVPSSCGWAVETSDNSAVQLVGVVSVPPFAFKNSEGEWEGITVDLWRHVAEDLGWRFEFREAAIPELLADLEQGRLAAIITAVASADRELVIDFSHPYYSSGLAIAVPVNPHHGWFEPLSDIVSTSTLKITGILVALLLFAAILVWLCERRANPEHFRPQLMQGLGDSLWWAVVTLTTVGYGDKAPRTRLGRSIGVIWMFSAVILIALFTAQVTSSVTVKSLTGRVRGPADLLHVRVGAIQDSQQQLLLRSKFGVVAHGYPGFSQGLSAVERNEVDAFVSIEPVLRYEIANNFPGRVAIVGAPFLHADYVFAFPLGSSLRKKVNYSILSFIESSEWREILRQYLGDN